MVSFKILSLLGLVLGASAQGQFNQPENSAQVLTSLQSVDDATIRSAQAAQSYNANNVRTRRALERQNILLRSAWQEVIYFASSSTGFYSETGAQAIIDFINNKLYPDTRDADQIYVARRNDFVASGFINFINTGLLQLRTAVDQAGSVVQTKTRASQLTNMTLAFLSIEQDYATTQEIQQFGIPATQYGQY